MANLGRVYDGVEYPLRHEACKARHRAYVQALAEGLNFTQAAHAVGVSKRTGKVYGVTVERVQVVGASAPVSLRKLTGTVCT